MSIANNTAVKCLEKGCDAKVLAGRGYCGKDGGPARLERERKLQAEAAKKAQQEKERQLQLQRAPTPVQREAREFRAQAEGFRQAAHDSRRSWGARGAAPGSGLSRFRGK